MKNKKNKFSNKRIGKVNNYTSYSDVIKNYFSIKNIIKFIVLIVCIFFVIFLGKYLVRATQSMMGIITKGTIETVSNQLGVEMEKDDFGNINILLVGYGGDKHAGGYLADTIIVASLNPEVGTISMISIPRDLYIHVKEPRITGKINKIFASTYFGLKDFGGETDIKLKHNMRMTYASKILSQKLEDITGLKIPYFALIDFSNFEKLIDHLGGISINVPESVYDYRYPGPNHTYQTFKIESGKQILDGETALKYARSRHSTSDFSRSHRQQLIIKSIISAIMDKNHISNVSKIKSLFADYQQMIYTNITTKEIIGMIKYKDSLNKIFSFNFTTECILGNYKTVSPGCFLYTPSKDLFNGASVILPVGATVYNVSFYDYMRNFMFFVANHQKYLLENPIIVLQNGISKDFARSLHKRTSGYASKMATKLKKYAFNIIKVENAEESHEKTTVYIAGTGSYPATIEMLNDYLLNIPIIKTGQILGTGIDMVVVIGNSYLIDTEGKKFNYNTLK